MGTMMVSLLFVLLGSKALAAPLDEDRDGEGEDDMILSSEQKLMLAQSEIKNAKDQEKADNYNEDKKPAKGGPQTGASRAITTPTWTEGILYYDLSTLGFHMWWLKPTIRSALKELQEKTNNCVQFVEQKSDHGHVEVHSTLTGCDSLVGYKGYFKGENQKLSLGYGCFNKGKIQHEFIHALGFYHTQGRSDRDRYIEIKVKNIKPRQKHNFKKYDPSMIRHYGLPFDYESIMMYPGNAFTKNGKKTIVTIDSSKQNLIGQRKGPSAGDIKMIKKAYEFTGNKGCIA